MEPPQHRLGGMGVAGVGVRFERRPKASMSEHLLYADWRRAVGKHLGRCGVTKHVRRHVPAQRLPYRSIERLTALGRIGSPDLVMKSRWLGGHVCRVCNHRDTVVVSFASSGSGTIL
jgi:hypothetical protein